MSEFDFGSEEAAADPAEAFEQMRRQLALLTAAVEGFASRQQRIDEQDYTPDLARLVERQEKLAEAIRMLASRPALALTPEALAEQIARAGVSARRADRELLQAEAAKQQGTTKQLENIIGHARSREVQRAALIWAAVTGMLTVLALWIAVISAG